MDERRKWVRLTGVDGCSVALLAWVAGLPVAVIVAALAVAWPEPDRLDLGSAALVVVGLPLLCAIAFAGVAVFYNLFAPLVGQLRVALDSSHGGALLVRVDAWSAGRAQLATEGLGLGAVGLGVMGVAGGAGEELAMACAALALGVAGLWLGAVLKAALLNVFLRRCGGLKLALRRRDQGWQIGRIATGRALLAALWLDLPGLALALGVFAWYSVHEPWLRMGLLTEALPRATVGMLPAYLGLLTYNCLARRVGGIEVELSSAPPSLDEVQCAQTADDAADGREG